MKKSLIITLIVIILVILIALGLFMYFRPDNYKKDNTKSIKVTNEYTNTLIKTTKEYKNIDITNVKNIEIIKFTEFGRESEYIEDQNKINSIYKSIGNIKIGTKNNKREDNNSTIYTFNSEDESVSYEFEKNNIIINNQGYTYSGSISY